MIRAAGKPRRVKVGFVYCNVCLGRALLIQTSDGRVEAPGGQGTEAGGLKGARELGIFNPGVGLFYKLA